MNRYKSKIKNRRLHHRGKGVEYKYKDAFVLRIKRICSNLKYWTSLENVAMEKINNQKQSAADHFYEFANVLIISPQVVSALITMDTILWHDTHCGQVVTVYKSGSTCLSGSAIRRALRFCNTALCQTLESSTTTSVNMEIAKQY